MPPLLFTNAALLGGLFALAIPILIHFLMRRKRVRLRFSTLQFFLKQDEKSGRRQKLRQWLLLAARLALFALIVLAFARPYQESNVGAGDVQQKQTIVYVLDRSASMMATEGGQTRWARAKEIIKKSLDGLGYSDQVSLVECATPSSTLFPFMPPAKLKLELELEKLSEGCGAGDLGEAIEEAAKVLSSGNLSGKLELCVVSDLQRQSCRKITAAAVPRQIELKVFPVSSGDLSNRAILDLSGSADGRRSLSAEAADFSPTQEAMKLEWSVDAQKQPAANVGGMNASLALPDLSSGWHRMEAHLVSKDPFPGDNVRYLSVNVPASLKTLSVEPRTTKHLFEEESFFVNSALEPGGSVSNSLFTIFEVDKAGPSEAFAILGDRERLFQYQLLLLPALRELPGGSESTLVDFVKQGGAIVFWMGGNANPDSYNSRFGKMLPAVIKNSEGGALPFENEWHLGEVDFGSPVFSIFRQAGNGDVTLPEFSRRCSLEAAEGAQVLARFSDAMPFLVVKSLGLGRTAIVNTSADTGWSDWPKRKTFVPWIHSLCHYLTRTEGSTGLRAEKSFDANTVADIEVDPSDAGKPFLLRSPKGEVTRVVPDARGELSARLTTPGFYSLSDPNNRLVKLVAVNIPKSESDLSVMNAAEFERQIVRCDAAPQSGLAAELLYSGTGKRDFWRILLLGAAVLLLLECALANRTFA